MERLAQNAAACLPEQRQHVNAAELCEPSTAVGCKHQPVLEAAAVSKRVDEAQAAWIGAVGVQRKQVRMRAARQDVDLTAQLTLATAS